MSSEMSLKELEELNAELDAVKIEKDGEYTRHIFDVGDMLSIYVYKGKKLFEHYTTLKKTEEKKKAEDNITLVQEQINRTREFGKVAKDLFKDDSKKFQAHYAKRYSKVTSLKNANGTMFSDGSMYKLADDHETAFQGASNRLGLDTKGIKEKANIIDVRVWGTAACGIYAYNKITDAQRKALRYLIQMSGVGKERISFRSPNVANKDGMFRWLTR